MQGSIVPVSQADLPTHTSFHQTPLHPPQSHPGPKAFAPLSFGSPFGPYKPQDEMAVVRLCFLHYAFSTHIAAERAAVVETSFVIAGVQSLASVL